MSSPTADPTTREIERYFLTAVGVALISLKFAVPYMEAMGGLPLLDCTFGPGKSAPPGGLCAIGANLWWAIEWIVPTVGVVFLLYALISILASSKLLDL